MDEPTNKIVVFSMNNVFILAREYLTNDVPLLLHIVHLHFFLVLTDASSLLADACTDSIIHGAGLLVIVSIDGVQYNIDMFAIVSCCT